MVLKSMQQGEVELEIIRRKWIIQTRELLKSARMLSKGDIKRLALNDIPVKNNYNN